jgi:hypothetical protein
VLNRRDSPTPPKGLIEKGRGKRRNETNPLVNRHREKQIETQSKQGVIPQLRYELWGSFRDSAAF